MALRTENDQKVDHNPNIAAETELRELGILQPENIDYSGAHEKVDPAEIKLVKKLDRWIMVSEPGRRVG